MGLSMCHFFKPTQRNFTKKKVTTVRFFIGGFFNVVPFGIFKNNGTTIFFCYYFGPYQQTLHFSVAATITFPITSHYTTSIQILGKGTLQYTYFRLRSFVLVPKSDTSALPIKTFVYC